MGVHDNIAIDKYPKQGPWLGEWVEVCFHYDADNTIKGRIVREDAEAPGVMIFQLEDGRYVLSTECQYRPPGKSR